MRDAYAATATDGYAPEYVRTTARCWEAVVQDAMAMGDRGVRDGRVAVEGPPPMPPTTVIVEPPVRVVYDCDNRYVFYNEAGYDLAVRYAGYGAGVLRVAHGGPFVWVAARFGPMQFWVGDTPIVYTSAMHRPCGGRRIVVGPVIYPWYGWRAGLGVYVGPRYVAPRYGPPLRYVVPRPNHPVMVVPPRRGRDDDWGARRPPGRPHGRAGRDGDGDVAQIQHLAGVAERDVAKLQGARIGFVFGRLGIVPEACSTWFLPRVVGVSRAGCRATCCDRRHGRRPCRPRG